MMNKVILTSISVCLISAGIVFFIYASNNHSECDASTSVTYGDDGSKTTTETHVCNEKFNF